MPKESIFFNFKSFILTNFLKSLKNTAAIRCPKKSSFFFCHSFIAKIFLNELNLNGPFYIRQQEYQSYKWNIHSQTKQQIYHKPSLRVTGTESQTNTCPTQMILNGSLMSEPIVKIPKRHSVLTNGAQR